MAAGAGGWIRRCCDRDDDAEVEVAVVGVAVIEEPAVELVENGVREEAGLIDYRKQLHKKKGGGG